ncbi:UDP-N-acetylmuramoyl-tripeptide--D-alanyl-D-alanine ligase [Demequina muriae]|uniref:UDP-N-acetylmuramoyl-tripeptide--D-alanyl-D-alanine ligase n=1 Tax=Demequina muriae TaxID=3051664 RepID=A0ABT8GDL1_9MICO|nr:UDP-N-acetylmuramoyl-tripeptide--D-alanyl-D-alanine ligase [Demequina sp. EGI L300058]MDN4479522.1 UDP-N-acetylmuramoyl-tripeptide--D-alanyl-D-alanine ligase [Demequina sp. EGI L300058]
MRALTAQWIANAVGGELAADVDAVVTSVQKDSRDVVPGALYVAFVGERVDGHEYAPRAFEAGATLALVSQPVAGPHVLVDDVTDALGRLAQAYLALLRTEGDLTVVGITGSNGKTTTKDLLAQVLDEVVAPVGSFNNEIGLPLTVLRADAGTRHLVLEMGASAPGDLAYLTRIAPLDVAVVLTVGTAHLGGYGSPEGLAAEKATLLDGLLPGGIALLNADDDRVAAMTARPSLSADGRRIRTFGTTAGADITATQITLERGRASFTVSSPGAEAETEASVSLRLVGEHHVTNALAAVATAVACGLPLGDAAARVGDAVPLSAHRMALTERDDGVWILDDSYNASPESMRAALRALKEVATTGRSFAVIGEMREMGDASRAGHEEIGLDAVRLRIDHLLVVGEGAKPAHASAVREGSWGDEAAYVATIDEARAFLDGRVMPGDTVLIKASHGSGLWKLADDLLGVHE